jgi:hypothetical protein
LTEARQLEERTERDPFPGAGETVEFERPDGFGVEERTRAGDEFLRLDRQVRDEPALEARRFDDAAVQVPRPGLAVRSQEIVRAAFSAARPRAERVGAGGLDLGADEVGPLGLAVLLQPVGVHQPRGVVVRVGADRRE